MIPRETALPQITADDKYLELVPPAAAPESAPAPPESRVATALPRLAAANVPPCVHDATPEQALQALRRHNGPVLVDLDETLYLRNSTEDFLDSAVPGVLALLLLRLLDLLQPWRWSGGEATRDVWRVRAVMLLLPWTLRRWRSRVARLAAQHANQPLLTQLGGRRSAPVIATIGFRPIVEPLVVALGLPDARIVAAGWSGFADRRRGKLALVREQIDPATLRSALFLTDSADDLPLLEVCGRALRTRWPQARYRRALSGVYLPGQYLTQVKRPGERYIVRGILQEDFAFWLLSSLSLAAAPATHVLGLLFLLLSFWTIYERGYVDNDICGARYEKDPKLSPAFHDAPVATPHWQPWLWALGAGAIAVPLLRAPAPPQLLDFAVWAMVLGATHAWFLLYNRYDKLTRVWMFSGLQFARTAAFAALVAVEPVGIAALGAHVLARWLPYYVYRNGSRDWPASPFYLTRLLFFVVLAGLMGMLQGAALLLTPTALALLAWNLFRARRELREAFGAARRLDRTAP